MHRTAKELVARPPEVDDEDDDVRRRSFFLGEASRSSVRRDWSALRGMRAPLREDAMLFSDATGQVLPRFKSWLYVEAMQAAIWGGAMLELRETPKRVVQAVLDDAIVPIAVTEGEVRRLEKHWGQVFGAEHPEDGAARRLLAHGRVLAASETSALRICSLDEFASMERRVRDRSPGPGGLPYTAWGATVGGTASLHRALVSVTLGSRPTSWFNVFMVIFIPSGSRWALACDPIVRALYWADPQDLGCPGVFADGIGVVAKRLFDGMLATTSVFPGMAAAAGPRLNGRKSQLLYFGNAAWDSAGAAPHVRGVLGGRDRLARLLPRR